MAPLPRAIVTLLTAPAYLPGALVLLHALHELHPSPRGFQIVCLVTPETVDAHTIGALRTAGYDLVIGVEPITSGATGQAGLNLMGRPDLNLALTKLHLFRLGSIFSTIIYLDADTLPIRPLVSLFDTTKGHIFSACPDIGWPDCFNSGVMVVRPQSSDFDRLHDMLTESVDSNGSFDGADQGLLNRYFAEDGPGGQWNRLPFTYNVTPSAAYQYAPAYKHYAHKINLIHFIGPHKPWSRLHGRPASSNPVDQTAFNYEALVDRWYAIYDRHVRPTAVHEPNLAKRFTVPEHHAVWNTGPQPMAQSDRLNLSELKATIEHGVASFHPGQYTSLPLEGRVDLIAPRPKPMPAPEVPAAPAAPTTAHPPQVAISHEDQTLQQHSSSRQTDHGRGDGDSRKASPNSPTPPQGTIWDGSRSAPPKNSRPEMIIPMKTVYTPAWEEPVKSQTSYFQTHVDAAPEYPSLPQNVQNSDWYKQFTGTEPDRSQIQKLFPWEKATHRHVPSRSFPKSEQPPPLVPPMAAPKLEPVPKTTKTATSIPTGTPSTQMATTAPAPGPTFEEAMASYTNAWDNVKAIDKYAKHLTLLGIGTDRRTAVSGMSLPSHQHHRHRKPEATSEDSADGDDEAEGGSHRARYHDKHAQTDRPSLSDAKVQASPESSPTLEAQDKRLKITLGSPKSAGNTYPSYGFNGPRGLTNTTSSTAKKAKGRVWDPKTDIGVMRQGSQHVLSRFASEGTREK